MRKINCWCRFCDKDTEQTAIVESWLDCSGLNIFVSYWTRCKECGNNVIEKIKEFCFEDL